MSWTVAILLPLNRSGAMRPTMNALVVLTPFQSCVQFHSIGFWNSDARFACNGIFSTRDCHKWATLKRCWAREGNVGQLARFACKREIFPQREVRITLPHQDTA